MLFQGSQLYHVLNLLIHLILKVIPRVHMCIINNDTSRGIFLGIFLYSWNYLIVPLLHKNHGLYGKAFGSCECLTLV